MKDATNLVIISHAYVYAPYRAKIEALAKYKDINITLITPEVGLEGGGQKVYTTPYEGKAYKHIILSGFFTGKLNFFIFRNLKKTLQSLNPDIILLEEEYRTQIAVLGAAFKPDSDDVRDSPALDIAAQIHAAGADVWVHDPKALHPARSRFPDLNYTENIDECMRDSDATLHLTEWKVYREIDPAVMKSKVKNPTVIDGRNALDRDLWIRAGWKFRALGRG